jgi:hypothetical protein
MSKHMTRSQRSRFLAVTLGVLALLALPSAALGHAGTATVSCTGADFRFTNFAAGVNTVHYTVTVDHTRVASGDFTLDQAGGSTGALHVPLAITGTATVEAFAWWGPAGVVNGETRPSNAPPMASETLTCAAPPASPAAPVPPPPAAPAPVPLVPPAQGVAGVNEAAPAGVAAIKVPSRCVENTARVTVTGRFMRDVRFSITGRPTVTRAVPIGRRTVSALLTLRKRGPAHQRVTARVRFRNGARPVTLSRIATRCAQTAVKPPFTG